MDLDQFEERAAIQEFDGGLTRFAAETAAARAQGYERHEVINAIRERNSRRGGDRSRSLDGQQRAKHVPGVQSDPEEKEGSVSEHHQNLGRDRVALPPLLSERRGVL